MSEAAYVETRERLRRYFDAEAVLAWARLTGEERVSAIRQTVREGRDQMRALILSRLPEDLHGRRVLDAGCGTGALATAAAQRGAGVLGVDVAANLVDLAAQRAPAALKDALTFATGDMLDEAYGRFDHAVFMDSLIHYSLEATLAALEALAPRVERSIVFTFAPATPALSAMHALGRLFPRSERAPRLQPLAEGRLLRALQTRPGLKAWRVGRLGAVKRGFYASRAVELVPR